MIFKKNNGFTLIEVIVSIAIIAMIAVLLSGFISSSMKARSISQERLQILALSTSYLNEIKSESAQNEFDSLSDLEVWLLDNGFTKNASAYRKTENSDIDITIYLNQNLSIAGLYEIRIIGDSPNVSEISISTVIKGGNPD